MQECFVQENVAQEIVKQGIEQNLRETGVSRFLCIWGQVLLYMERWAARLNNFCLEMGATMITADEFRQWALALSGTSEAPHFDRTAFRAKRNFATMISDGSSAYLLLTPDEQQMQCTLKLAWQNGVK